MDSTVRQTYVVTYVLLQTGTVIKINRISGQNSRYRFGNVGRLLYRYDDSLAFAREMWPLLISEPEISRASGYVPRRQAAAGGDFVPAFVTDIK